MPGPGSFEAYSGGSESPYGLFPIGTNPVSFRSEFVNTLRDAWAMDLVRGLVCRADWSPMPWSSRSRREGIPPSPESFDYDTPLAELLSYESEEACPDFLRDDLLYFPDTPWLGGFHDGYPRSTSLSAYAWIRLSLVRSCEEEEAAVWRNVMLFGVLEIVTGMQVPEALLLSRRPDGTLVLTSANVSRLLSHWLFGAVPLTDGIDIRQWVDSADRTIEWALHAIDERIIAEKARTTGGTKPSLQQPVADFALSSLTVLARLLRELVTLVSRTTEQSVGTSSLDLASLLEPRAVLHSEQSGEVAPLAVLATYLEIMVANGWCPSMCRPNLSPERMAYASALTPLIRRPREDHTLCTIHGCKSPHLIVDNATYKTQHVRSRHSSLSFLKLSSCPFLLPSLADVSELLEAGQLPVIVYNGRTLTVRNAADGPYIAISHVWADGLGSTTEQGLPACQVARISDVASRLVPGSGAFWIDSLCIPGSNKELRKCAIRLMADTYRGAAKVVVLDAELGRLSTSSTPLKEVALRIAMSAWMRRIWTLQEGLLSRELYFEFADGIFPFKRVTDTWFHAREQIPSSLGLIRDPFLEICMPESTKMLNLLQPEHDGLEVLKSYSLEFVLALLGDRSTSKAEDETPAIAALVGVDIKKLLAVEGADARMKTFLLELNTNRLPAAIIFGHGPKLQIPGFRWAPRTFTSLTVGFHYGGGTGMAHLTHEGLTTEQKFPLVRFHSDLEVGRSDQHPDGVVVHNPTTASTYATRFLQQPESVYGEPRLMNGLIVKDLPLEPESSTDQPSRKLLHAVAVRVVDPNAGSGYQLEEDSEERPVLCEYLFPVSLTPVEWSENILDSGQLETVLAGARGVVVEASFTSALLTIT
ncbi:hypothetical protein C8Q74DRAFT_1369239 [Fomes fomentarius]|nr:hypothetical protein C8Q74DRAFT_1369239 [Fomes fomentarius]